MTLACANHQCPRCDIFWFCGDEECIKPDMELCPLHSNRDLKT